MADELPDYIPNSLPATGEQKEYLLSYMEKRPRFAQGEFTGPDGKENLKKQWRILGTALNDVPGGSTKGASQWQKFWVDQKQAVKKRGIAVNQLLKRGTGGGPPVDKLSLYDNRLLAAMGGWKRVIGVQEVKDPLDINPYERRRRNQSAERRSRDRSHSRGKSSRRRSGHRSRRGSRDRRRYNRGSSAERRSRNRSFSRSRSNRRYNRRSSSAERRSRNRSYSRSRSNRRYNSRSSSAESRSRDRSGSKSGHRSGHRSRKDCSDRRRYNRYSSSAESRRRDRSCSSSRSRHRHAGRRRSGHRSRRDSGDRRRHDRSSPSAERTSRDQSKHQFPNESSKSQSHEKSVPSDGKLTNESSKSQSHEKILPSDGKLINESSKSQSHKKSAPSDGWEKVPDYLKKSVAVDSRGWQIPSEDILSTAPSTFAPSAPSNLAKLGAAAAELVYSTRVNSAGAFVPSKASATATASAPASSFKAAPVTGLETLATIAATRPRAQIQLPLQLPLMNCMIKEVNGVKTLVLRHPLKNLSNV